jgi:hypothetical protein
MSIACNIQSKLTNDVYSLSAGVSALPAMIKLVSVIDSKLADWTSMEELPVRVNRQMECACWCG